MSRNLLFITWDGPQTSYMEGLFLPIFQEMAKKEDFQFHVIQFTWANAEKKTAVKKVAQEAGIFYTAFPVLRKPIASLGSLYTVLTAAKKLEKYIIENHIDIVMPRSTFPAIMVNRLNLSVREKVPFRGFRGKEKVPFRGFRGKEKIPFRGSRGNTLKVIFDADGFPLEERLDFSGLKKESRQYQWLKAAETKLLRNADAIITRSQKAIDIHVSTVGEAYRSKFAVVKNGRDPDFFRYSANSRLEARKQLQIKENEKLFVYCGSLGDQYCFGEMQQIFEEYQKTSPAKFFVLTGNTAFAEKKLVEKPNSGILIKSVPFEEIPFWLSAADFAFALRQPTFSMQAIAPIKLGEYLLMGIPTIASAGIGDTEEILQHFNNTWMYDHRKQLTDQIPDILSFIKSTPEITRDEIRAVALEHFSLEVAAQSYSKALQKLL